MPAIKCFSVDATLVHLWSHSSVLTGKIHTQTHKKIPEFQNVHRKTLTDQKLENNISSLFKKNKKVWLLESI